jgi:hypothetical protein
MIVAETAILATMLCTSPCKKMSTRNFQYTVAGKNGFQISSDDSLGARLSIELRNIPGVRNVAVNRNGNNFDVHVSLESLDFQVFDQVIKRELYLFDEFPRYKFHFSILPAAAVDEVPALHAA